MFAATLINAREEAGAIHLKPFRQLNTPDRQNVPRPHTAAQHYWRTLRSGQP